ncbi:MAG: peptide ABC transporter substrate-binding protein [Treponema sp.]|jgi:oligopeptide transport system substrate-binding protein|nr:peptide ABC transporter substrate-binding protein [Treponema sp.]
MKKRIGAVLFALAAVLCTAALIGCGGGTSGSTGAVASTVTAVFGSEPNTIDPALNSSVDGAIYIQHAFEGLYKYVDAGVAPVNGLGKAQVVPGMAASAPAKQVNADGTVVLTYTLRSGLKWSDGSAFTAHDFVYTWQRLVDPETAADYSYMIDMVVNANEIMAGEKAPSELGIRAVNDTTLVITLVNDCAYFDEIAAFPATFPVQKATIDKAGDQWTFDPATYVSNGPYRMKEWVHNSYILFEKNPNYYETVKGPDTIKWALMDDSNAQLVGFRNGELDFIENVPVAEIPSLIAAGSLHIADYLGTYYVSFNNAKAPFTDPRVRKAFSLAIDRNYIVNQITQAGQQPASGFVPAGMSDAAVGSDFRATGGDYYSLADADYQKNVAEARQLLADAGYPNGQGFPVVEYLYNTLESHRAIGEALQDMWTTALGVNVTLSNMDWAVFLDVRKQGDYIGAARDGWIGDYNDPVGFLDMFVSGGGNNNTQYANPEFDSIIAQVKATSVQADRMRLMHQAEDILVGRDASMAPIYFYTQTYMLNPQVTGMYYTPLGYFFFTQATVTR